MKKSLIAIFLFIFCMASLSYAGDTTSLISYWLLDDDTTTTADGFDSNTLTENGAVTSAAGAKSYTGNSHRFSAGTAYWDRADTANLSITSDMTMQMWVNMDAFGSANSTLMAKEDSGYTFRFNTTGKLIFESNSVAATASTGAVSAATWTNVAVVFDNAADTVKYYIGDPPTLDTTVAGYVSAPTDNASNFGVGAGNASYGKVGTNGGNLDDVVIFARTLTLAEIQDIANNGISAFASGSGKRFRVMTLACAGLSNFAFICMNNFHYYSLVNAHRAKFGITRPWWMKLCK